MPILQDPKELLGSQYDDSMQYSIVPVYRVPSRQGAGWVPVGPVIENGSERVQLIARKKSRQLLEQEAKQAEQLAVVQENRNKPRPNTPPRFPPSAAALLFEDAKKLKLHRMGLHELTEEEVKALEERVEGKKVEVETVEANQVKVEEKQDGEVHMGSARKRVPRRRRDSDAPSEGGARRRLRKIRGADRPAPVVPVLPESDDS